MYTMKKSKNTLALLLSAVMVLTLLPVVTAKAADPRDGIVTAVNDYVTNNITPGINNHNLTATLESDNTTVTITGSAPHSTNEPVLNTLTLEIPAGITVDWQAEFAPYVSAQPAVCIDSNSGAGSVFKMSAGRIASYNGTGSNNSSVDGIGIKNECSDTKIIITGNSEVKGSRWGSATYGIWSYGDVEVSDSGYVVGGGGDTSNGIYTDAKNGAGNITVTGNAKVTATGNNQSMGIKSDNTTSADSKGGKIIVSGNAKIGGTTELNPQYAPNMAIAIAAKGEVEILDNAEINCGIGKPNACYSIFVSKNTDVVSLSNNCKVVNYYGCAFVFENDATQLVMKENAAVFGKNTASAVSKATQPDPSGKAVIITWTDTTGKTEYTADSTDDLKLVPSNANVKWAKSGDNSGISYADTGFIKINGVTVNEVNDIITYSLTVEAGKGGTATGSTTLAKGETTTITATPKENYSFNGWEVSGAGSSVSNSKKASTTFTMGDEDATVKASFKYTGGSAAINKKPLQNVIKDAKDLITNAKVGTSAGQYPQSAVDTLQAAIDKANNVLNKTNVTQSELDQAKSDMDAAIEAFKASIIKDSTNNTTNNNSSSSKVPKTGDTPESIVWLFVIAIGSGLACILLFRRRKQI